MERASWNRYGEGPNLQGHILSDRVNPIAVRTQREGLVQIEGPCADFQLCEGRGERHYWGNSHRSASDPKARTNVEFGWDLLRQFTDAELGCQADIIQTPGEPSRSFFLEGRNRMDEQSRAAF